MRRLPPNMDWILLGTPEARAVNPILQPHGLKQPGSSFTISWSLLKLMSIELVILYNHLIVCRPLLPLPSVFPRQQGLFG